MASIDEMGAYGVDTNFEDGHEVHYYFNIHGFLYTDSLFFARDYETMCRELPTWWKIVVRFQRLCSFKAPSCQLSVKRIDISPIVVRVSSAVTFYNSQLLQMGMTLSFPTMLVTREEEVIRTADPALTPTELTSLLGQELKVRVSLKVTYCHRTQPKNDPISSLSDGLDRLFF